MPPRRRRKRRLYDNIRTGPEHTTEHDDKTRTSRSERDPSAILSQALENPESLTPDDVKQLQQTGGNRATSDLLANGGTGIAILPGNENAGTAALQDNASSDITVQAKLTLGPTNDQYEREADQVASQVTNGKKADKPGPASSPSLQTKPGDSTNASSGVTPGVEKSIQGARGGGRPLDKGVRGSMENSMGADFGGVRVHTDSRADKLNQSLQSRAFTTGKDVFFRKGEYNPGSKSGQQLIAHELTHTIQQGGSSKVQRKPTQDVAPEPEEEVEAKVEEEATEEQTEAAVEEEATEEETETKVEEEETKAKEEEAKKEEEAAQNGPSKRAIAMEKIQSLLGSNGIPPSFFLKHNNKLSAILNKIKETEKDEDNQQFLLDDVIKQVLIGLYMLQMLGVESDKRTGTHAVIMENGIIKGALKVGKDFDFGQKKETNKPQANDPLAGNVASEFDEISRDFAQRLIQLASQKTVIADALEGLMSDDDVAATTKYLLKLSRFLKPLLNTKTGLAKSVWK